VYNRLIKQERYDIKYQLEKVDFLIIEESDKVCDIIKRNKSRKKEGVKKLSNNHVMKIENIGSDTLMRLEKTLKNILLSEGIKPVYGRGCRKSSHQKREMIGTAIPKQI